MTYLSVTPRKAFTCHTRHACTHAHTHTHNHGEGGTHEEAEELHVPTHLVTKVPIHTGTPPSIFGFVFMRLAIFKAFGFRH